MRGGVPTIVVVASVAAAALATAGSPAPRTFPGPNGKMVLGGLSSIRLLNPDGSGNTTIPVQGGMSPVWSADGRWLAYSSNRDPWTLRVMRADGTGDREVLGVGGGNSPMHYSFAWSPTGAEIAYQCSAGLCAVRVADGTTRQVLKIALGTAESINPAWSPDGTRIAFQCRVQFRVTLCMVRSDGTEAVAFVLPTGIPSGFPDWSPDGSRILVSGGTRAAALDVDGDEARVLVDLGGGGEPLPPLHRARWSPDGRSLALRVTRPPPGMTAGTYVVPVTGGQPVKVADAAMNDWGSSPAVTVSESQLEPTWVLSRQAGRVHLRGVASHASSVSVAIRSLGHTYPSASVSVPAGGYAVSTRLPRDLLPGPLEVVVSGTSGTELLLTVIRPETLPAPATGLVSRSWISVRRRGAPRARVPHRTTTLFAQFAFSVRPAAGQRLRAVWVAPSGAPGATVSVRSARIVSASVTSDLGLQRGRWRCRLEAGRTPLAIASVRVG
ncbi:MAG: TolB family protein [Gaiellaceae bacterium]